MSAIVSTKPVVPRPSKLVPRAPPKEPAQESPDDETTQPMDEVVEPAPVKAPVPKARALPPGLTKGGSAATSDAGSSAGSPAKAASKKKPQVRKYLVMVQGEGATIPSSEENALQEIRNALDDANVTNSYLNTFCKPDHLRMVAQERGIITAAQAKGANEISKKDLLAKLVPKKNVSPKTTRPTGSYLVVYQPMKDDKPHGNPVIDVTDHWPTSTKTRVVLMAIKHDGAQRIKKLASIDDYTNDTALYASVLTAMANPTVPAPFPVEDEEEAE